MQIFKELNENKNLSLALGYFDGVHLGHQEVIKSAVKYAKQNGLESAVITFKDHPCCYFYGVCPKYILQRDARQKRIEALGVDYLYELSFDEGLSKLSAEEYLQDVLIKHFSPKAISTGFNHFFGFNKSGNANFLAKYQNAFGYKYFELPPKKFEQEIISSTLIRSLLSNGDIKKVNAMLGCNFEISGVVVDGQKIGRTLGFRTANVIYPSELIDIPFGVYEVETQYGKGITNFGIRPTISDSKKAVLETHILNFDEDIYGAVLYIKFIRMLRCEQKFESVEQLKKQIHSDINSITN